MKPYFCIEPVSIDYEAITKHCQFLGFCDGCEIYEDTENYAACGCFGEDCECDCKFIQEARRLEEAVDALNKAINYGFFGYRDTQEEKKLRDFYHAV